MSATHVEALEVLLRSPARAAGPEFKTALVRLSLEIKERLDRGSSSSLDFVEASVRALAKLKGSANAQLRMKCLCDSGQFLYSNGRSPEALIAAAECEQLARRSGDEEWVLRSQMLHAMVQADLGNIGQAVIQYSAALATAQSSGNLIRQVSLLINLGVALNYAGLYREALPCFERAISVARRADVVDEAKRLGPIGVEFIPSALSNLAQSLFQLGRYRDGFPAIQQCLAECVEPWDASSAERRAIREFTYVLFALELGKLAAAREHALKCHYYGRIGSERGNFHGKVATALCDVHGGDSEAGLERLEGLLHDTRAFADRQTVLSSLIRSYDQMGRPELALARITELQSAIRAQRNAGIAALLSLHPLAANNLTSSSDDLAELTVREAQLRARVAERRLVTERIEMFERLAIAADLKEDISGQHGYRVGRLAALLAERLSWSKDTVLAIERAARLHDIGKIAMPDRILFNCGELKEAERHFVSMHTIVGSELLSKSELPEFRLAEDIARYHHEWWNGTGYPSRLSGNRIPIAARIVALADVFDALTHSRSYSPPWSLDAALTEISTQRDKQFDPNLTDLFVELIKELRASHSNLDDFLGRDGSRSPFLQARARIQSVLDRLRADNEVPTQLRSQTRH